MIKLLLPVLALGISHLTYSQYCTTGGPSSTLDSNTESVVLNGAVGAINWTGCPGAVAGVQEVLSQTTTLNAGASYLATIQFGTCNNNYAGAGEAWIDFNANMVFEPSESIGTWQGTPPTIASIFNFTVPLNSVNGSTRMRVIQQENATPPLNPCGSFTWGSVTDFTIVIQGGAPVYCNAGPSQTADSNVESVVLNGTNATAINYTGCPGVIGLEQSTQSVDLGVGNSFQADVQFGTCGGNYGSAGEAWIDFNQNFVFEPSESIGSWQGVPPTALSTFNFTVPMGAVMGPTKMRVIQQEGGVAPPLDPCATFTWGSAVDFNVNIVAGIDCSGYQGDDENDAIVVNTFPYTDNHANNVCYTNQNPVYNSPDVYYLVIPSANTAELNISLCNSGFDTFLSVFDTQGNVININDDAPGCGTASELTVGVAAHDSVYVIVEGYSNASGSYELVINENGTLDISELESSLYQLYPNPAITGFEISNFEGEVQVIDSKGNIVIEGNLHNNEIVDITSLNSGFYLVRLKNDIGVYTKKLIVE
jgi:hypothetical protein